MIGRLVLRRLLQALGMFLGASLLLFAMVNLLPGDEIRALFGFRPPPPEVLAELRELYHMDDPFFVRYGLYMADVVQGDFGPLYNARARGNPIERDAVNHIVAGTLPTTLRILGVSLALQLAVGVPLGIAAARADKPWRAGVSTVAVVIAVALPPMVLASIIRIVTLRSFHLLVNDDGWLQVLVPGAVAAVVPCALLLRLCRQRTLEVLREPWAKVSSAMGISEKRIRRRYAARQVLVTAVTLIAAEVGPTIGSLLIVETVFRVPGLGSTVLAAARNQQGPLIMGGVLVFILIAVTATLLADIAVYVLEPRTRAAAEAS